MVKLFADKNEHEIKVKSKGLFLKFDPNDFPSYLEPYITKDQFHKYVKEINKILSSNGKIALYAMTIVLFPVSMYYVVKVNREVPEYFLKINLELGQRGCAMALVMRPFNERVLGQPKQKLCFFYPQSASIVTHSMQQQQLYYPPQMQPQINSIQPQPQPQQQQQQQYYAPQQMQPQQQYYAPQQQYYPPPPQQQQYYPTQQPQQYQ